MWITLRRHPSIIATRVAGAAMPIRGIRRRILAYYAQLTSQTSLGEHWRAAKKMRGEERGQDKVGAMAGG